MRHLSPLKVLEHLFLFPSLLSFIRARMPMLLLARVCGNRRRSSSVPAKVNHLRRRFLSPHLFPSLVHPLRPSPNFNRSVSSGTSTPESAPPPPRKSRGAIIYDHHRARRRHHWIPLAAPRLPGTSPSPSSHCTVATVKISAPPPPQASISGENPGEPPPSFPIHWIWIQ